MADPARLVEAGNGQMDRSANGPMANHRSQAAVRLPFAICHLPLAMLLLAALSYWAPWVDHPAAALRLSGQDLGEFVKFVPALSSGFPRQVFYLPPLVVSFCLVLIGVNRHLPYGRWLRVLILGLAVLVLPGLLPPVWGHPRDLFAAEFRLQGLALVLGLAFVLAHGLFRRIPLGVLSVLLFLLALFGLLPAQGAFWSIRPQVWAVYNTPTIRLGWGLWFGLAAWAGLAVSALAMGCVRKRVVHVL